MEMTDGLTLDATNEAEEYRQLRLAWADFLGDFEWSTFATLTFAQPTTLDSARRGFNRWIRRLEQRAGGRLHWFMAVEASRAGNAHIHALCNTSGRLATAEFHEAWPYGVTHVERYDPSRGARHYLVKEMGNGKLLDYDVSTSLKRLGGEAA